MPCPQVPPLRGRGCSSGASSVRNSTKGNASDVFNATHRSVIDAIFSTDAPPWPGQRPARGNAFAGVTSVV